MDAEHQGAMPRRVTDRIEDAVAWVLASLMLVSGLVAVLLGWGGVREEADRADAEQHERVAVRVVLLQDAEVTPAVDGYSAGELATVPGRWHLPRGVVREMPVSSADRLPAGSEVRRWVDRDARPVPPPMTDAAAVVSGVFRGLFALLAAGTVLGMLWWGVRHWTALRNAADWAEGWRRVEPSWSGRRPPRDRESPLG